MSFVHSSKYKLTGTSLLKFKETTNFIISKVWIGVFFMFGRVLQSWLVQKPPVLKYFVLVVLKHHIIHTCGTQDKRKWLHNMLKRERER